MYACSLPHLGACYKRALRDQLLYVVGYLEGR